MEYLLQYFSVFCHQLSGRSAHYDGMMFPLCYRCTGFYIGVLSSFIFLWINRSKNIRIQNLKAAYPIIILLCIWMIDGSGNYMHYWNSSGLLRAFTGMCCGITLPFLLQLLQKDTSGQVPFRNRHLLIPIALGAVMIFLLEHPFYKQIFGLIAFFVTLGSLAFIITWLKAIPQNLYRSFFTHIKQLFNNFAAIPARKEIR